MGTHPIFESDFDCLTDVYDWSEMRFKIFCKNAICRSTRRKSFFVNDITDTLLADQSKKKSFDVNAFNKIKVGETKRPKKSRKQKKKKKKKKKGGKKKNKKSPKKKKKKKKKKKS